MAKVNRLADDNDSKFVKRFKGLIGETTPLKEIAKEIGTTRQTLTNWLEGTMPDTKYLEIISRKYNVSINWLTGVSDVRSTDITLEKICELSGLSEKAWLLIEQANNDNSINILNLILESDLFSRIVCNYRDIDELWTERVDYSSEKDNSRQQALNEFVEAHHAELDSFQGDIELKNNVIRTKEICKSIQFDIQELQRELQKEIIQKITGIDYL